MNSFYVRSLAQVVGMLTATVAHVAASAVQATRRPADHAGGGQRT